MNYYSIYLCKCMLKLTTSPKQCDCHVANLKIYNQLQMFFFPKFPPWNLIILTHFVLIMPRQKNSLCWNYKMATMVATLVLLYLPQRSKFVCPSLDIRYCSIWLNFEDISKSDEGSPPVELSPLNIDDMY